MKLNDPLLAMCNGEPEKFLALTDSEIIEFGRANPALLQHVPLSIEHREAEELKAKKAQEKAEKKAEKEALAAKKLAEKEMLAKMTPEEAKAYRKKKKLEKQMEKEGQPKLDL
jgi:hypothetical protein